MVVSRLVNLIEQHAEELTREVVHELRTDPRTPSYRNLPSNEDFTRVFRVVHNFGMSLDHKSDATAETTYRNLGKNRFAEGVPLAELVCALLLTKQTIQRFAQAEGRVDSALDLCQQVELNSLIDRFFERAIYFAVLSYESEARSAWKPVARADLHERRFGHHWSFKKSTHATQ